jgi:hypothetical protein
MLFLPLFKVLRFEQEIRVLRYLGRLVDDDGGAHQAPGLNPVH